MVPRGVKMPKTLLVCLMLSGMVILTAGAPMPANQDVRIAHSFIPNNGGLDFDPSFLARAKLNGFNYVMPHGGSDFSGMWNDTTGRPGPDFISTYRRLYTNAHNAGMRMIPFFGIGGGDALEWGRRGIQNNCLPGSPNGRCSAPFAPDAPGTNGMDSMFRVLIRSLDTAFQQTGLPDTTQKYIHINFSEIYAGVRPGNTTTSDTLLVGSAPLDQAFLSQSIFDPNNNGLDSVETENAIDSLFANWITRRVTDARAILGNHLKVIIWGDMVDPEHIGGWSEGWANLYNGLKTKTYKTLLKVPPSIRSHLIIMPWLYTVNYPFNNSPGGNDYNTDVAYDFFKNNGYKFIPASEITADHDSSAQFNTLGGDFGGGIRQFSEYLNVAAKPEFRGYALGHATVAWLYYDWHPTDTTRGEEGWARHSPPWNYKTLEFYADWATFQAALFP